VHQIDCRRVSDRWISPDESRRAQPSAFKNMGVLEGETNGTLFYDSLPNSLEIRAFGCQSRAVSLILRY
jgi:hypothetical protein